jgi:hypothetical protein
VNRHQPVLHAPWYADPADGCVLHRYLDEQFVPRFLQQAQSGRLQRNADQAWRSEDRFSGRLDYPTLRLPVHRAFYIASCEVSCDSFGLPALDPKRIVSAGMVVRRGRSPAQAMRWIVKEGVAMGWWDGDSGSGEPCDCRRLRQLGLLPERYPEPAYSGEETYPMHPLFLHARGADGVNRSHTLLWGYLPLGGQVRVDGAPPRDPKTPEPDYGGEHAWPFGSINETSWRKGHGYQVRDGMAQPEFRQLLTTLLSRYHIQDARNPDNAALRQLLASINFQASPLLIRRTWQMATFEQGKVVVKSLYYYSAIQADDLNEGGNPMPHPERWQDSLLFYLDQRAEQILEWLSWQDRGETSALPGLGQPNVEPPDSERNFPRLTFSLYIDSGKAEALRDLLEMRARAELDASDAGTAMPRFNQEADDVFFTLPFLRYLDAKDCERIVWGPPSQPFRVASPLAPQAQRPSLIVLPALSDLKLGGPRGLTFVAPKSLADKILQLKLDMDIKKEGPGNPGNACFGFSFSLPVITLVALILLMIMINLLNIIFWWLPYAFLALPRLCLRAIAKSVQSAAGGGG